MGKNKILLVIASLLILGLLSTRAQVAENYNSSKSNTATAVAPFDKNVVDSILREIDREGPGITEEGVKRILHYGKVEGFERIKHIEIRRTGNRVEVLLLEDLADRPKAEKSLKALEKKPIQPKRK